MRDMLWLGASRLFVLRRRLLLCENIKTPSSIHTETCNQRNQKQEIVCRVEENKENERHEGYKHHYQSMCHTRIFHWLSSPGGSLLSKDVYKNKNESYAHECNEKVIKHAIVCKNVDNLENDSYQDRERWYPNAYIARRHHRHLAKLPFILRLVCCLFSSPTFFAAFKIHACGIRLAVHGSFLSLQAAWYPVFDFLRLYHGLEARELWQRIQKGGHL